MRHGNFAKDKAEAKANFLRISLREAIAERERRSATGFFSILKR